jgi:DNA-binding ferritin-like protein
VELKEICAKYVAFLRALYLLHQNHHWLTCGANFYGNHLLFERIYKVAQESADLAAEKFIGVFGHEALGVPVHGKLMHELLEKFDGNNLAKSSLDAEKEFLDFSKLIYDELEKQGKMSLGVDDMIMSIASNHEGNVYLLKQILGDDMSKLSALAKQFQTKLAQTAEVGNGAVLRNKINSAISVHLGNKNWGEVGVRELHVSDQDGHTLVSCNFVIPPDAPPFTDKTKYPNGLNQFKQEMMTLIGQIADGMGINELVQVVKVNDQ